MLSTIFAGLALAAAATAESISITPHDRFSSSVGVLGCHIDTNRVAYFPSQPGCDSVCIKLKSEFDELYLLHIDTSGGAFDVSYDAWNRLYTGKSATEKPMAGGGIPVDYEPASMDKCAHLIKTPDGKLPIMAANSIGYYVGCGAGSWIGQNAALYNIQNSACTLGFNEVCTLDLAVSNQPSCAHILGAQNPLSGLPVTDILYPTGQTSIATQ